MGADQGDIALECRCVPVPPEVTTPHGCPRVSRTLTPMATPARAPGRQINLVQALALLIAFLLIAGIGGVLSAGLVLPAVAGVSALAGATTTVFKGEISI